MAAAQGAVDREKEDYYLDRYEELEALRLLPAARAVANAFDTRPLLDDAELEGAIRNGLGGAPGSERTDAAKETLRNLGYVWRPAAKPVWEPDIPSLMAYVQEHVPSRGPGVE